MDIVILSGSQNPIYEQIYEQIVIAIVTGDIKPHECLPSMRAIARELNVSVITTQKTYEKLEANGYTYTVPGKGCFISERAYSNQDDKFNLATERLMQDIPYLKSLGITADDAKKIIDKNWNS